MLGNRPQARSRVVGSELLAAAGVRGMVGSPRPSATRTFAICTRMRFITSSAGQHLRGLVLGAVADGFNWRACSLHLLGDVVQRFDWWLTVAGQELNSGIYHSTMANCVIGNDVLVRDVRLLANYVVERDTVLLDCGRITCDPTTSFGNGAILPIGIETGGRELPIYAEIDIDVAAAISGNRHHPEDLARYGSVVADYATRACCGKGIIEHDAVICHTPQVCNTYVGPHARIGDRRSIAPARGEPVHIDSGAGCESLLQWGSRVSTLAVVERSVLTEHSHVDRQGK